MPKQSTTILIATVIIMALFLTGIFALNTIFPLQIKTSTINSTLPPPELNVTTSTIAPNTTIKDNEPSPSFTGAIIVGITRPVAILGKEGFSPAEMSIVAGDSITWKNTDPGHKLAVLTFQRGREQNQFFNSPALRPGEEWVYVFWEEGEYNYWSTIYGVEGKVIVQPCKNRFCPRKE